MKNWNEEEIHSSPNASYFIIYQKKNYVYIYIMKYTASINSRIPSISFDHKNRTGSYRLFEKRSLTKEPASKEETLRTSTILNRRSVSFLRDEIETDLSTTRFRTVNSPRV